jgi:ribosomal protein L16 Arg81 hydroxylase
MGQRRWRSAGSYFNLFIGAGGTKTNLHGACSHNLFTQVYGQKHWTIISPEFDPIIRPLIARTPYFMTELDPDNPDLQRYPEFEYIDRYQCVLKEGDILYNPASWWHKVSNLSTSIGFGFRWFDPIDSILISKTLTLQFLGSTNPSLLQYISFGKNNFTNILTSSKS